MLSILGAACELSKSRTSKVHQAQSFNGKEEERKEKLAWGGGGRGVKEEEVPISRSMISFQINRKNLGTIDFVLLSINSK